MTPRRMAERGMDVHVLPATSTLDQIMALDPDGLFLSNGPGDPGTADGPAELARQALRAGLPVVGICFGHQIIAQALGGKVEKFAGGWSVGPTAYDFDGDTITLNAWHQDQVVERPKDAQVLASNDFCENAALLYDDRAFTVQAHPEFRSDFVDGLMKTRGRGLVPDPLLDAATARLDTPLQDRAIAARIAEFFKHPRG